MSDPAYRGRHRAPAGRHRAVPDAFVRPQDPAARRPGLRSRLTGPGYLLPTAAAATLVLTATGAHIGGSVTPSSASAVTGSTAAALLTASGMATEDPIQRDLQYRAARDSSRGSTGSTGSAGATDSTDSTDSTEGTDATPNATEEMAKYDAQAATAARAETDAASAAKARADAQAAAQAQTDAAAAAKALADASAASAAASAAQAASVASAKAWRAPLDGGYTLTSGFGVRWGAMHPGQDFAVATGTPVHAMSSGTVTFAGWQGGYGYKVEIQYWDGTVSWFCHNSKLLVSQGEQVTSGEVVSMSGSTGHSTGPHVHLEIHPGNGSPVSPGPWLANKGVNV